MELAVCVCCCFSSVIAEIEEVIEDMESAPLTGMFGATGDEMVPTDPVPPPLADNKLLPPLLPLDMQRRRYFWTNSSGAVLNWVLNSRAESSAGSKVGTTFIKNLSVFFESEDIVTKYQINIINPPLSALTANVLDFASFNTAMRRFDPVMKRRGGLNFEQDGKTFNVFDGQRRLGDYGGTGLDLGVAHVDFKNTQITHIIHFSIFFLPSVNFKSFSGINSTYFPFITNESKESVLLLSSVSSIVLWCKWIDWQAGVGPGLNTNVHTGCNMRFVYIILLMFAAIGWNSSF